MCPVRCVIYVSGRRVWGLSNDSVASELENFVAFLRCFFACTLQDLSRFLYVCTGSSFTEKFFCSQSRNFLSDCQIDELIEGYSLALSCLASLFL